MVVISLFLPGLSFFFFLIIVYLLVSGLSCIMHEDLCCSKQTLVVVSRL